MHSSNKKVLHVSVEGGIGVGKSTVLSRLKTLIGNLNGVEFVDEPVHEWVEHGFLQHMYDNSLNKCAFQHLVLMSLAADFGKAIVYKNPSIVITERSPVSNYHVFAKENLKGIELEAYHFVWNRFMSVSPEHVQSHYVYLDAHVSSLVHRRTTRNRDGEADISLEYMQAIHKRHTEWINSEANGITVDANAPGEAVFEQVCTEIVKLIESHCPQGLENDEVLWSAHKCLQSAVSGSDTPTTIIPS